MPRYLSRHYRVNLEVRCKVQQFLDLLRFMLAIRTNVDGCIEAFNTVLVFCSVEPAKTCKLCRLRCS